MTNYQVEVDTGALAQYSGVSATQVQTVRSAIDAMSAAIAAAMPRWIGEGATAFATLGQRTGQFLEEAKVSLNQISVVNIDTHAANQVRAENAAVQDLSALSAKLPV